MMNRVSEQMIALCAKYDVMYHAKQGFHNIDEDKIPSYLKTSEKQIWKLQAIADDVESTLNPFQTIPLPIENELANSIRENANQYKQNLANLLVQRTILAGQILVKKQTKMLVELGAQTTSDLLNVHNHQMIGKTVYSIITNTGIAVLNVGPIKNFLSNKFIELITKQSTKIIESIKEFNPLALLLKKHTPYQGKDLLHATPVANITALVRPDMTLKEKITQITTTTHHHNNNTIPVEENQTTLRKNTHTKNEYSHTTTENRRKISQPRTTASMLPHQETQKIESDSSDVEEEHKSTTTHPPKTYFRRIDPPKISSTPYVILSITLIIASASSILCTQLLKQHDKIFTTTAFVNLALTLVTLAFYGVKRYNNNQKEVNFDVTSITSINQGLMV